MNSPASFKGIPNCSFPTPRGRGFELPFLTNQQVTRPLSQGLVAVPNFGGSLQDKLEQFLKQIVNQLGAARNPEEKDLGDYWLLPS